ncbi:[FeFe] hydrogenase H-cluster radical SAM maturase HydE [uncultured Mailhella sp.]|uniref:[FeFe] hydrogenase H-cluster radical SAM maturase HydE n=1 Tax=uncultured Mailhella sp. TaxID=1981031 RepID=UPI0025FFF8A2|nr:[FeFe] hydrogenase H-cluster radical SAM maturase HydE [uncultured Mailhella sp.]
MESSFLAEAGLSERVFEPAPKENSLSPDDARHLRDVLFNCARRRAQEHFGNRIYIRGLIEISNICRQNCRYCGIRAGNAQAERYRLSPEQILECCEHGYGLGFRTFVLQGGEDAWFTDERLADLLRRIKSSWPDCAVTLSVGERSLASYGLLRQAGADRFLLRHETADPVHYAKLHPAAQSWQNRMNCLRALKACGYQTGAGFMVGSPWQTTDCLVEDLLFLRDFQPEMVGIGPFIPHAQTPFAGFPSGSVERTLVMVAMTRLMLPFAMLPATTALGTAAGDGRERGILAGANVLMPNLSPREARARYRLYNNKLSEGAECADNIRELRKRIQATGYEIVVDRGDFKSC